MVSSGSPVLLIVGGLLAAGSGFALLGATEGQAGSVLIVGGVLLVISAFGVAVGRRPTAA